MLDSSIKIIGNELSSEENQAAIAIINCIPDTWRTFNATLSLKTSINMPIALYVSVTESKSSQQLVIDRFSLYQSNSILSLFFMRNYERDGADDFQLPFDIKINAKRMIDGSWDVLTKDTFTYDKELREVFRATNKYLIETGGDECNESSDVNFSQYLKNNIDSQDVDEDFLFIYHRTIDRADQIQSFEDWYASINDGFTLRVEVKAFLNTWCQYIEYKKEKVINEKSFVLSRDNYIGGEANIDRIFQGKLLHDVHCPYPRLQEWLLSNPTTKELTTLDSFTAYIGNDSKIVVKPFKSMLVLQRELVAAWGKYNNKR
tara:strand:+ start:4129 stop:5079 length:951 start_codon:yes stop_codon:yes gene_type:complete